MKITAPAFRIGLAFLVAFTAGCIEIPLQPEIRELTADRNVPNEASELLVIIHDGKVGETDRKMRWVVFVDGEPRAVLPDGSGYTRISVPPGPHVVIAALRGAAIIPPIPSPVHFEKRTETSVTCEAGSRCGVAVDVEPPTTWKGLRMSAQALPGDQLEQAIQGLTLTEADQ